MLKIKISGDELWDEETEEFRSISDKELYLEHSLISISKWESIHHKPFFLKKEKTTQETIDYVKCMVLNEDFDFEEPLYLDNKAISKINDYINDSYTATWFKDDKKNKKKNSSEQVTSELVYYWMVALNIPFECERWHFNRLLTLIEICNRKNEKPKKMSNKELYNRNTALNELRRKQMNTHG